MGIGAGTAAALSLGATALGAGASLYGATESASAQSSAARAIAQQNQADEAAQNAAFTQRMQAEQTQTEGQFNAAQQTLQDQQAAAQQMQQSQSSALTSYQQTLAAENQQEDLLRGQGDTAAQTLLSQTSGPNLAAAQTAEAAQAADLLQPGATSAVQGPGPTDPSGGTNPISSDAAANDPAMAAALARRTAEAATNIRTYGAEVGKLSSYDAPTQAVNLAIAGNKTGIMSAEEADQLLRSGSSTMLLPSQVAYQNATNLGTAANTLIQNRGQNALDAAALTAGNATQIANLTQSDAETIAANQAAQAKANAAYQGSVGSLISGIGNTAVQAGAAYGGLKGLSTLFGGSGTLPASQSPITSLGQQGTSMT